MAIRYLSIDTPESTARYENGVKQLQNLTKRHCLKLLV